MSNPWKIFFIADETISQHYQQFLVNFFLPCDDLYILNHYREVAHKITSTIKPCSLELTLALARVTLVGILCTYLRILSICIFLLVSCSILKMYYVTKSYMISVHLFFSITNTYFSQIIFSMDCGISYIFLIFSM